MTHSRAAATLAAIGIAALAGCGDDDSSDKGQSSAAKPPTRAAYVAEVTARCRAYGREREAVAKPLEQQIGNKSPEQLTTAELRAIAPVQRAINATTASVIKDVGAFPVPAALKSARDAALGAARAGLADQEAAAKAMAAGDRAATLAAFKRSDRDFGSANAQGKLVGLDACG
jgi:hypothetical protein